MEQMAVNIAILNVWSRKREQLCRQSVAINLCNQRLAVKTLDFSRSFSTV